ncbi:MAG: tRNA (guanosine(46)-N7)-methyltransferase TrmB [Buchnera aphidicola (Meitanaphis microgallis)]
MIADNIVTSKYNENGTYLRGVHSFVSRNRKLSGSKYNFLNKYWPKFGVNFQSTYLKINNIFYANSPIVLEIGFGMGESLSNTALKNLSKNFLGIEVYLPGIISCLKHIRAYRLKNVRIIYHDAVEVLTSMIYDKSMSKIQMFFPDPWPKRRHCKRRIFTKNFAKLIFRKLVHNGILHISTDCQSYAEEIVSIVRSLNTCNNLFNRNDYNVGYNFRPITKFERRGMDLGHTIFDLIFKV